MRTSTVALVLCTFVGTGVIIARQATPAAAGQGAAAAQKQQKSLAKLAEPWPDAATIRKRREDSERRALFQAADPLALTIRADFRAINRDRDPAEHEAVSRDDPGWRREG